MWRLALARSLARVYQLVLRHQLHTYTSVFGVYRRSRVLALPTRRAGFIGITEMLARLDLSGATIVEHPVALEARIFGRSKLRLARAVVGHLGLLAELAWHRVRGSDDALRATDAQLDDAVELDRVAH
jgi:hypothetical protein